MVSRLYATTRPRFQQLILFLMALPLRLPPGRLERVALYLTGLIFLDRDQTACRIARYLSGKAHDALNYLLRRARLQAHTLMQALVLWVKGLGPGFLCPARPNLTAMLAGPGSLSQLARRRGAGP
jgi:hypothetical protein